MIYELNIAPRAKREMEDFVERLHGFAEDVAEEQLARLSFEISSYILETPRLWNYFFIGGAPYHGYLFRFGRKHHYWIVYTVDEETSTVNILRFWNTSQDPQCFEI